MSDVQAEQREPEGRAAVRRYLIERLEAAGMTRPRRVSADAFEAQKKALADRLAYMGADNLMTLADVLITASAGRTEWPPEVAILQYATGLQAPPPSQSRIVTSWLASVEGPKSIARGDLVELYRFVRRRQVPPTPYDQRQIAEEARDNARWRQIFAEKAAAGVVSDDDRRRMAEWQRDYDAATALVDAGNARRTGGAA